MNQVLDCIYSRSSVRKYTSESVPESDITELLKAGFHAPNGMNTQSLGFVVIEDSNKLKELNLFSKKMFLKNMEDNNMDVPTLKNLCSSENSNLFYDAPVVIMAYSSPTGFTPIEDGSMAFENMMLAAKSLGYGTCFIGLVGPAGSSLEFKKENNIPEDHSYVGCIIVGVPDGTPDKHLRSEVKIYNWIK